MSEGSSFTVKAKCTGFTEPAMYNSPPLPGRRPYREGIFSINGSKEFAVDVSEVPFPFAVGEELEITFAKLPPQPAPYAQA